MFNNEVFFTNFNFEPTTFSKKKQIIPNLPEGMATFKNFLILQINNKLYIKL